VHIACLYSSILIHGAAPDDVLMDIIITIPKGKNANGNNYDNYCGISLSSVFGRVLDNIDNIVLKFVR
jgi:hypothetical protein